MSQTYIFTFKDQPSYTKYKKEVTEHGGTIRSDLGTTLLGFTADIPPTFVELVLSSNLKDDGITSFEPGNSKVTIQA